MRHGRQVDKGMQSKQVLVPQPELVGERLQFIGHLGFVDENDGVDRDRHHRKKDFFPHRLLVDAVQDGEDLITRTLHHFLSKDLREEVLQLSEVDLQAVGLVGCCNYQLLELAVAPALNRDFGGAQRIHCVKSS